MTVGVLVEGRYLSQRQPLGLATALRRSGHVVRDLVADTLGAELGDLTWLEGLDLLVARGRSHRLLCLLAAAEYAGVPTMNRLRAVRAVHDKAAMASALRHARLPTPPTWLDTPDRLAELVPASAYPVILKPPFGDNGRGLVVVEDARDLAELAWPEPLALAQEYRSGDGTDLKLYGVGASVWAVRKPSPFEWPRRGLPDMPARVVPLTASTRELALSCGRLFGLDLWGVDCVDAGEGPQVIEVNEYPNYTGVRDADACMAALVAGRLAEART